MDAVSLDREICLPRGARVRQATILLVVAIALLAITPALADTLLVGNKAEDTVSFIDLDSGREVARAETGKSPHEIAISPNGRLAAVVAYGGNSIDVFDIASAKRTTRIDLAANEAPHGIAWLRDGRIVATSEKGRSVVLVKPGSSRVRAVPIGQDGSHMLAVSPDQRRAYVANIMSGTVSVIDLRLARKLPDIEVGGYPEGIAITPDGRELWVGDNSSSGLRVVDLASREIVATLVTDPVAIRVAISPDGLTAVTSHIGSGVINVFDVKTRKALRRISVSGKREAVQVTVIFSPDGKRLYVAETGWNTIAEVDLTSGQVVRRLSAGRGGDGLGIAP